MTMRLSPILKYQFAIDIHVISMLGGAAAAGTEQIAAMANVVRRANLDGIRRPHETLKERLVVAPAHVQLMGFDRTLPARSTTIKDRSPSGCVTRTTPTPAA